MPKIDTQKLEEYASVIYERLEEFNEYTLQTIARRIKAIKELSAYDAKSLKNMADITGDMKKITKKLAEITEQNIEDVEKIYTQTVSDGVNTYEPLYDFKNMEFVPFEQNEYAKALVENWANQTAGEMINLSRTKAIGFDKYDAFGNVIGHKPLKGAFEQAISSAVTAVSSGTTDFNLAMKKTIEELGGSGVKVIYGSGVNRSLSAMIRQNVLYGAKQSAQAYDEYVGRQLGCDGFEVDAHAGCRPSHMFMQGKMYSYDGRKVIDGVVYEDGKEALKALGDYGCLHLKTDVILGISPPRYSKKELDKINRETTELIEYDGRKKTLYEWKQKQRQFERTIRNKQTQADMFKTSGNYTKAKDLERQISAYRAKYEDMCDKLGLKKRNDRMMTYKGKTFESTSEKGISKKINFSTTENTADMNYINSTEYKNKFAEITENKDVNEAIYKYSKAMITHRNGTYYEDIYIVNGDTGKFVAKETNSLFENVVNYTESTEQMIKDNPNQLIAIHNHGTNNPPTGSDLVSAGYHKYKMGVVVCHNGDVYTYQVGNTPFSTNTFDKTVDKFKAKGYNESKAIIKTLNLFKTDYGIRWKKYD